MLHQNIFLLLKGMMYVHVCVCIVSPPQYLRSGSPVYLERLRYLQTVLSRLFRIWTTAEPNKARAKNIAQAMVWQIFGLHTMTCLVSKSTYLTWTIWWWPQISQMKQSLTKLNQTKTWNKAITMVLDNYLWTYCDRLGKKTCTWAREFNGGLISDLIQPHMKPNKPKTWLKPWFWPIFGLQQYVGFQNHVYKGKVQWKNKNSKNYCDRVQGWTPNLWNRT